ncbi:MAG TPA: condensation domain-containing protein, partial [Pseudomonadales bacterium]|nr:condensation domain-containing protein [Pseudomonadales bacterium]
SLLGYVIVPERAQENFDATSAREQLKHALPDFMIPSHVMMLAQWPLSPNGKVDRKALPVPDANAMRKVEYVAPRTDIEQEICAVWEITLKRSPIGAKDNFFDLGGHSLLATQILSKVRALFKVELPLKELFRTPTIEGLAALVERQLSSTNNALPPVTPRPDDAVIPLSLEQQRLWFLQLLEPENVSYNMPAAVRIEGELDSALLERALKEIVRRHAVLRTRLVGEDDSVQQVIDDAQGWQLMRVSAPDATDEKIRELIHSEANRPFNLAKDCLFRVTLIQRTAQDHVALLNMHHVVADGWSVTLLLNELVTLYAAYAQGVPSPLPELSIQYADYAYWQATSLQGEALENKLNYWKQQLAEAPVLELPTDKPRPHLQSFNGDRLEFLLNQDTTRAVYALSRRLDATPFMTLLTLFNVMLSRYSAQYDISVGIPVANRPQVELEPLIGFFVNTLVIRTRLTENPSFADAV